MCLLVLGGERACDEFLCLIRAGALSIALDERATHLLVLYLVYGPHGTRRFLTYHQVLLARAHIDTGDALCAVHR